MWGIYFDLAVGLCITGANRSDRSVLEIYICKLTRCQIMYPNSAYGHGKCAHGELLFHFGTKAGMQWPFFVYFFSLTITDKTNISLKIKILHLRQGSFTRKVRTIFTLKIIVNIYVKLFLILVLHLTIFYRKNFCEKGYRYFAELIAPNIVPCKLGGMHVIYCTFLGRNAMILVQSAV